MVRSLLEVLLSAERRSAVSLSVRRIRRGLATCLVFLLVIVSMLASFFQHDTPARAAGPAISNVTDNRASYAGSLIPRYSKFEVTFGLNTTATNLQFPYDTAPPAGVEGGVGVSVDGLFSADNWVTTLVQPGFLYQDYSRERHQASGMDVEALYPQGSPAWKLRF